MKNIKSVKIEDGLIEYDETFGPLPNNFESFEDYFVKKGSDLLKSMDDSSDQDFEFECIVKFPIIDIFK